MHLEHETPDSGAFFQGYIGTVPAHPAYLSHRNRCGRQPIGRNIDLAPAYFGNGTPGLTLA